MATTIPLPHLIMGKYKHTEFKGLAKGYMASK